MKKFIKYLFYFALPFIILAFFFEIYLRQIDTSYTEKEKGIIQNKNKIEFQFIDLQSGIYLFMPIIQPM